jgi:hypothetical protein
MVHVLNDYLSSSLNDFKKWGIYPLYASYAKEGFSEHIVLSWDALIGLCLRSIWELYWWGDAPKRVLLDEGCEKCMVV